MTPAQVIAHLAAVSKPASIREIAHALGLKHSGRRFLPRIIQQLKRKGEVEEQGNRYRLPGRRASNDPALATRAQTAPREHSRAEVEHRGKAPQRAHDPNLIAGRIVAHRDGYGFVVPDKPIPGVEGDLFIPRDHMNDAMHGDRVVSRIVRRRPDGRAEGRVVQILEREHPTIVGLFRYGPHGNHVLPYDVRIHHEIFIPAGQELTPELVQKIGTFGKGAAAARMRLPELDGAVVNVEVTRFPSGGLAPAGRRPGTGSGR